MTFHTSPVTSLRSTFFSPNLLLPAEKWYKRHLTYRIINWPRLLPLAAVRLAVSAAFQLWSNVSGLVFLEAPEGPADIRLAFYEGDHNDGTSNAFDGPGQPIRAKLTCRLSELFPCFRIIEDKIIHLYRKYFIFTEL